MKNNALLWTLQVLLALLFLFAGVTKLVLPVEQMTKDIAFPGLFLRFIGVAETLGGLGLVLPALTGIRTELTPLAAVGLLVIMIGAVGTTLVSGGGAMALIPFVVGVCLAVVAYGRWESGPTRGAVSAAVR